MKGKYILTVDQQNAYILAVEVLDKVRVSGRTTFEVVDGGFNNRVLDQPISISGEDVYLCRVIESKLDFAKWFENIDFGKIVKVYPDQISRVFNTLDELSSALRATEPEYINEQDERAKEESDE